MKGAAERDHGRVSRSLRRARRPFGGVLAAAALVAASVVGVAAPASGWANHEPFAASQWGLRQIAAQVAWDVTRGRGARVGIIDTGVDLGHEELAGRVVASTRCLGTGGQSGRCGGSAQDDRGHGTHVAGIIGAPLDGAGVAGVAPEASLLVVKALEADGSGEASDVAAGIDWLLAQGVHVVNLSLSETISPRRVRGSLLEAAIVRAAEVGAVVVIAAGNSSDSAEATAFNLPAIVVGATDRNGNLAGYSLPLSTGIRWGMVAPGGDARGGEQAQVISTYWLPGRRNAYAWNEGTSMAAPHVAGVAALLAAQGVQGRAAVDRLLSTAAPASCGAGCRGRLNAQAAVGATLPGTAQVASNGPTRPDPAPVPGDGVAPVTPASPGAPAAPAAVAPPGDAVPVDPAEPASPEVVPVPEQREAALQVPSGSKRRGLLPALMVVAALALLAVTSVTAVYGRRRLRADEGW
jgi:thermitase